MYYYAEPWDTVEIIAQKFGICMNQLFLYNPWLYYQSVYIGQKLFIPLPYSEYASDTFLQKSEYRTITYTVKVGDTLESIARYFNTTVSELMRLNGLANEMVSAGDKLLVRTNR